MSRLVVEDEEYRKLGMRDCRELSENAMSKLQREIGGVEIDREGELTSDFLCKSKCQHKGK